MENDLINKLKNENVYLGYMSKNIFSLAELSLAPQIRPNSSKILRLRSNVEVT